MENRSLVLPIRFRQKGSAESSWVTLLPGSSSSFNWEDLLRERMVEVLVDGADPTTARSYGLDQVAEYPPLASTRGPVAALHCSVYREGAGMVLRVEDWKPSTGASCSCLLDLNVFISTNVVLLKCDARLFSQTCLLRGR